MLVEYGETINDSRELENHFLFSTNSINMSASGSMKIIVFVPESHADAVRQAMGDAGAGTIGNYSHCSFSSNGIGRFRPKVGAHPAIGTVGILESVPEERIEMTCSREILPAVITAMKQAHPYEEVVFDVYALLES